MQVTDYREFFRASVMSARCVRSEDLTPREEISCRQHGEKLDKEIDGGGEQPFFVF